MPMTQVTSASDWRKPRELGYLVELPSGNTARLGPVDLSKLLLDGEVPDLLSPFVNRMLFEGMDQEEVEKQFSPKEDIDQARETAQLVNRICRAAFIEPRIVDSDPADDEILIEDVDLTDRAYVFSIAIQGAMILKSFRIGQEEDVETVRDGEDDGSEAEPAPGDRR